VIDGRPTPGEAGFDVVDPAAGQVFAQTPDCARAQLDAAVAAVARGRGGAAPGAGRSRGRGARRVRPIGTVMSRLSRARRARRESLTPRPT
jgi:acyl-CoA reductase-like NAD-dependent aldehyde dehydrogenase